VQAGTQHRGGKTAAKRVPSEQPARDRLKHPRRRDAVAEPEEHNRVERIQRPDNHRPDQHRANRSHIAIVRDVRARL